MVGHQWLVGGVALTIGGISLFASLLNHTGFFQLGKVRMLESLLGRNGARWVCGILGCTLILIGGMIVAGKLPRKTSQWQPPPDSDHECSPRLLPSMLVV